MRQYYQEFIKRDTEIISIGPEDAEAFQEYWQENQLPFIGLPDESHSVLNLYQQETKMLKLGRMPAQMLIDKEGILRFVHYGNSMKDIPSNQEIFEIIDSINAK